VRIVRKGRLLARRTVTLPANTSRRLMLRLGKAARPGAVTVRVTATDAAGVRGTAAKSVKVGR
jgi:hypothetical protein